MRLMEIATHLETNGAGRIGETIFIDEMPLECVQGILLMNTYAGTSIDHEMPGWRDTGFRLVVRSPNYEVGYQIAEGASEILTIRRELQMSPKMTMRLSLPQNDPLPYRRSKGSGIWEFEVDIECIYILS